MYTKCLFEDETRAKPIPLIIVSSLFFLVQISIDLLNRPYSIAVEISFSIYLGGIRVSWAGNHHFIIIYFTVISLVFYRVKFKLI